MIDPIAQLSAALAGRYHVEREIGAGGMATVYLARDLRHDRRVTVSVKLAAAYEITGRQTLLDGPFTFRYLHASYDVSPD